MVSHWCSKSRAARATANLDDGLTTEEYLQLHETCEELGATTELVCVFFTADVESGIPLE